MICKFCTREEKCLIINMYMCEECQSVMCVNCMWTSVRSGRDYCIYCKSNLQYEGKVL